MAENQSLGFFLNKLEKERPEEVLDIHDPMPRDFVFMAMAKELDKEEFPPIIRAKIEGYDMPVLGNVFASRKRIANMLGFEDESKIAENWAHIEKNLIAPKIVKDGPIHDVVLTEDKIDCGALPLMQYYPTDAGRYISSGIVVVKDPETGVHNLSIHRMQYKGPNRVGISLHSRRHLYYHYERAAKAGKPLEVAIIVGAHPSVYLAAVSKPALEVDEYEVAGAVLDEALELVRGKTVDVYYPAEAEIVLEGKILIDEHDDEGPFGEFTGYSTSRSTRNIFEVTAVCQRKNPYYEIIVPGNAKDHLFLAGVVRETFVYQRLKESIPWVKGVAYTTSGVNFHCYVQLEACPEGVAKQALTMLLGLDYQIKLAIAVDEDVDITRDEEVLWAVATRCRMRDDLFIVPNSFIISLDPTSKDNTNDKVCIDATMSKEMRDEVIVLKTKPEYKRVAADLIKGSRS